ncbi:LOW QUALITY PROTEIN: uncharacterized protein [Procambarus clarkii]|uniref:LOW QUALITY PROTEIN: uncharacterized protein n=1 Tax=Procambarus clarkii TaxID=6728 RepID=UPI0037421032
MSAHARLGLPGTCRIFLLLMLLLIFTTSEVCVGNQVLGAPSVADGGEFFSTNTLAEVNHPSPLDYESLLERIHGNFGARAEVTEGEQQEPEYEGSETLVVPLYIPEGAVPINMARIARSGIPEPMVELLNMKVSPAADSVLIRRIGPVGSQGTPAPPTRRNGWRPPQRTRLTRLTPIRRSDQLGDHPVVRPPPPPFLLAEFGQRLPGPHAAPLVAVRRVPLTKSLPYDDDDLDDTNIKRAKKNEFSKDTQFPEGFHTTDVPENEGHDTSSELETLAPTTQRPVTTTQSGEKHLSVGKLFQSPLPPTAVLVTATTASMLSTTTPHTTIIPNSTFELTTTRGSPTTATTMSPTTVASAVTTSTTTEAIMTTVRPTTQKATKKMSLDVDDTSSSLTSSPPTTKWDRRSVLFPRPVESILKNKIISSTTTTTQPSTTTTATTRSPVTQRNPPLWHTRLKSPITRIPTSTESPATLTTSSTTVRTLAVEKFALFSRLHSTTTKRPLNPTTEGLNHTTSEKPTNTMEATFSVSTTTGRPLRATLKPAIPTMNQTTATNTLSTTTTTTPTPLFTFHRPVVVVGPERSTPMRVMPSVSNVSTTIKTPEERENSEYEENEETSMENPSQSPFTTNSPNAEEVPKNVVSESSSVLEMDKDLTNRTEEGERSLPVTRLLASGREEATEESTTKGAEQKHNVTGSRKYARTFRPVIRPGGRRRRPLWQRSTVPPPITYAKDFFIAPEETLTFSSETEGQKITVTTTSPSVPDIVVSTTLPTTTLTTDKSPEQIVIESLTEIMKDATNNNKSKDKVLSIATNLELLNKQLAERGIHIIHAEVDGVKIKLDNRTVTRPILQPVATTFRPSTFFNVSSFTDFTTERPLVSTASPVKEKEMHMVEDYLIDEKAEKQMFTSVKSSFSFHTTKPIEDEVTDNENEVQSTTNDSSFTTTKPVDTRKFTASPGRGESQKPALSSSILPFAEETEADKVGNVTGLDGSSKTPVVEETSSPVRTSISRGDRDKEVELEDGVTSKAIFATSTVPSSVTTRTRSTTVPITTHRPATRPFVHTPRGRLRPVGFNREETVTHIRSEIDGSDFITKPSFENSTSRNDSILPKDLHTATTIHPTSHHRPSLLPPPPKQESVRIFGSDASISGVTQDTTSTKSTDVDSASTAKTTTTTKTKIEVIPFVPEFTDASENMKSEDLPEPSPSSYTAVYIIGVIGIIPAAALTAFLAKKFLKKTQKALPESEERGEGFTPITHHSRKPSHSTTLEADGSSVEAKNPHAKYTPWEFPRSKLRLVSVLGEGNFGVVSVGEARELCACEGAPGGPTVLVAVKCVKEGAGVKERHDLLKELAIMQHLGQHHNVVTLLGCCTQQEPHYVIMEYVMFGKLLTFLRDHRTRHNYYNFSSDTEALTSRDLTRFACQVATGCDYLQSRGIIHRDLASRNILVDHNKVCKIADFGLARNVKDLGTDIYEQKSRGALPIRWMAPESLYMSIFTHKSDVWSFGILCWEIVTLGSTPYPGMTAREVMRSVREGYRLDRPDHCHPELYRIVTKCWHQDLNKRPSFSEITVDLAQLLEHGQTGYIDLENFPEGSYYSMHENNDEKL